MLWFLTAGWLWALTLRRIHFRNAQTASLRLMKALQIWDRAGSRLFFLGSSVDNSQMWPLQDKVHAPQGRERRIKSCAERKHVRLVSATSHFLICVLPFHARKFLLWLFPTLAVRKTNSHERFERLCGRHMFEMGWFKLINVMLELFVFQDVWTHASL